MKIAKYILISFLIFFTVFSDLKCEQDTIAIHNLGHASLMFEYNNLIIHVDPWSKQADYTMLPDADLIFVTHAHSDHYDLTALNNITKDTTLLVCNQEVKDMGEYTGPITVMMNGDTAEFRGVTVVAVPAYNITNSRHVKGVGNGYVFSFGKTKVYVAGDTENIDEMENLDVNIAFIPMNQPYTMTPEQAADAALKINPDILYIYHCEGSDTAYLRTLLNDHDSIEVRIGESLYYEPRRTQQQEPSVGYNTKKISKIYLYPNPVSKYLYLENLIIYSEIIIISSNGRIVKEIRVSDKLININLEDISPGYYFIKIKSRENIKNLSFIKIL